MSFVINNETIETDKEGYLENINDWSESIAEHIAQAEALILTQDHWDVIHLLRQFYHEFELSPAMRPLVKYVGLHLGKDKGNSIYLLTLFPPSPAKIASKIAGLPRPANCL
jgi:tRNA 2-thiouridine synthesizing protein E